MLRGEGYETRRRNGLSKSGRRVNGSGNPEGGRSVARHIPQNSEEKRRSREGEKSVVIDEKSSQPVMTVL
jgi:hypothetical protein